MEGCVAESDSSGGMDIENDGRSVGNELYGEQASVWAVEHDEDA